MLFIKKQNISDEIKCPLITTSPNSPTMKAQFSVQYFIFQSVFTQICFCFLRVKKQDSDIYSVRQNRGKNVRCIVFSSVSSVCWEELRPLAGSQLYTKFKVMKRNLTYSQGWNYLPSLWYQKIPMLFVYFPPPKCNRGHAQNLQQEQSRVFSTQHSQSPPAQEEGSWSPGPRGHSASSVLFHFSQARKILSCAFSSLWLSLQIAERKRSCAQIPVPQNKTAFQLSTTKTKYKATVPPPSSALHHSTGQGTLGVFLLSERKHKQRFPKALMAGSQVPEQDFIIE